MDRQCRFGREDGYRVCVGSVFFRSVAVVVVVFHRLCFCKKRRV